MGHGLSSIRFFNRLLMEKAMVPVLQEEVSGCGIAASAALAGVSYSEAKRKANALGIDAQDKALWSDTEHVRQLLHEFGIPVAPEQTPFESWERLPDKALLAIKWRMEKGQPFWHGICQRRLPGNRAGLQRITDIKYSK